MAAFSREREARGKRVRGSGLDSFAVVPSVVNRDANSISSMRLVGISETMANTMCNGIY